MNIMVMVMKKLKVNENGFIPMLIMLFMILIAVIVLAFLRVAHSKH
jgi:hypothetical protein